MSRLTRYFLEGLLILAPASATIYVIYFIFTRIDRLYRIPIPGAGIVLTFAVVTLIGFVASNVLMRGALGLVDRAFAHLPVARMVYTSVRDLVSAFVGDKKGFHLPVAVELIPGSSVYALGFVTNDDLGRIGMDGLVAVYLPQSYNFAGNLILVPPGRIIPLKGESSEHMAFIVSGGLALQERETKKG